MDVQQLGLLEPNDGSTTDYIENGREDYLHFWAYRSLKDSTWNDAGGGNKMYGSVVEYAPRPIVVGSLEFDGNDRVTIPDSPSLDLSQLTVECRVNFARLATDWPISGVRAQELVSKGYDDVPGQFGLRQQRGANVGFLMDDKAHWAGVSAEVPLMVDQWYQIAVTYDGQMLRLYVDGTLVGSEFVGAHELGNSSPLHFGYHDRANYEYQLAGQMDEVRIWGYARTAEQLQATMGAGALTGAEPGLVGYWNFNEAAGSQTVFDLTANGNHGYLGATSSSDDADPTRINPVSDPSTLTSVATGGWSAPATWDDGTATPTEDWGAIVNKHTVAVATDGIAQSLVIADGGKVVVGNGANLTIVNDLLIDGSSLVVAPPAR